MAKSRAEINKDSNVNRGIVSKNFKLHQSTVDSLKEFSERTNKSQAQIVTKALAMYISQYKGEDIDISEH